MGRDGAETDALHSSRPTSNPRHQADAVLCGRPHDTALRPDADALLDALPAGTQHLLATAFLTSEHEVALTRRFRRAVRVSEHSTAGQRGVMVPTLRQLFRYLGPGAVAPPPSPRPPCPSD